MTSKKALERIMNVLGLTSQSFFEAKTEQGLAVKMEGELELGAPIYISTEEGLIPAPPGVHKLDDGSEIEVDEDGKVIKIKMGETKDEEIETEKEEEDIKDEEMSDEEFGDIKLASGGMLALEGEVPAVGLRVMKKGYDGTLSAITDGLYETTDGQVLSIVGGAIEGVQSKSDNEKRGTGMDMEKEQPLSDIGKSMAIVFGEDYFTIAKTADGATVESKTFDVGEEAYLLKDDGSKEPAPDGEHQVVLKDSKGEENKIRIMVKDGKIVERENVEESMEQMEQIASMFAEAIKRFESKLDMMTTKQKELENKFQKFSKEPAGSRVYTQKTINEEAISPFLSKYEAFRRMREDLTQN
jgi:hypothetical protein